MKRLEALIGLINEDICYLLAMAELSNGMQ